MKTHTLQFANRFIIKARRTPREESPQELGGRTLRCLDAIIPLHAAFHDWQFIRRSRDPDEMEENNYRDFLWPLEQARLRMTDVVVEWAVNLDDFGQPEPRDGYDILASNRDVDLPQSVILNVDGGGLMSWTGSRRNASFETSMAHEADPTIVSYPVFKAVLMAIISCWDVEFAQAYSRDLAQLWDPILPLCNLSWMVYLSAPLARQITVPADIVVERLTDGGLILIAAEETFDVANPDHVARARSIVKAMELLNAEEAERKAKRRW
jgi:hypothetical protein